MNQKRSYKRYPKEFKEEAVALITNQGYSVPEAAKSLGVASNLLSRWKDQQEALSVGSGLAEGEKIELQRLRKENKTLRMEGSSNSANNGPRSAIISKDTCAF